MRLKYERICKTCNSVKPPRSHHCSVCGRCVMKMDHHCPWMNNCIGLTNQKAFLLFNFYVFICSLWTSVRVLIGLLICYRHSECTHFKGPAGLGVTIAALIICILFALFTIVMFCDQVKLILEDTSTIDQKQMQREIQQAKLGVNFKKKPNKNISGQ